MQIAQRRDPDLDQALEGYVAAKADADQALRRLEDAEAKLLALLEAKHRKSATVKLDGLKFSATYTQRTTNTINEEGLRKALTARVFDRFTVKKLDRKALEKAMTDGEVDPVVVAQFVEQVPGKAYLTYRVKEDKDEEPEGR